MADPIWVVYFHTIYDWLQDSFRTVPGRSCGMIIVIWTQKVVLKTPRLPRWSEFVFSFWIASPYSNASVLLVWFEVIESSILVRISPLYPVATVSAVSLRIFGIGFDMTRPLFFFFFFFRTTGFMQGRRMLVFWACVTLSSSGRGNCCSQRMARSSGWDNIDRLALLGNELRIHLYKNKTNGVLMSNMWYAHCVQFGGGVLENLGDLVWEAVNWLDTILFCRS